MIKAEAQQIVSVGKDKIFRIISGYADYPKFVYGVKSVRVERKAANTTRATFTLSIIRPMFYTVDLIEDAKRGTVRWSLVESDDFKINSGFWEVKDLGSGKSEVRYGLELEFKATTPVPMFILKRLMKVILPLMVKSFEKRAREQ